MFEKLVEKIKKIFGIDLNNDKTAYLPKRQNMENIEDLKSAIESGKDFEYSRNGLNITFSVNTIINSEEESEQNIEKPKKTANTQNRWELSEEEVKHQRELQSKIAKSFIEGKNLTISEENIIGGILNGATISSDEIELE